MSVRQAEADLAALDGEAEQLRAQRSGIDARLAELEDQAKRLRIYLEVARAYELGAAANLTEAAPAGSGQTTPQGRSTDKAGMAPSSVVDDSAVLRANQGTIAGDRRQEPAVVPAAEGEASLRSKSLPDAAMALLSIKGRPLGNYEIAEELQRAGVGFVSKDPAGAVETALRRRVKQSGEVVRVAPGTWGMVAWYDAAELEEFARGVGGVPGRDFEKHVERTRESLKVAKQRGVQLGRRPVITAEKGVELRRLLEEGTPMAEVAKRFGVTKAGVYRWLRRHAAKPSESNGGPIEQEEASDRERTEEALKRTSVTAGS